MIIDKPQDKQFLRRDQRRLRLPRVGVDSQPCEEHKATFLIFYNKNLPQFFKSNNHFFGKNDKFVRSLLPKFLPKLKWRKRHMCEIFPQ